jgi:rRNA maturation RNase YbeY
MIAFRNEDSRFSLDEKLAAKDKIRRLAREENKRTGELCFVFCSDEYLLELNRHYLNHDYYTDVITFDYGTGNLIAGDIFVSIDRVKENAGNFNVPFNHELSRVIYHAILHLCGYGDKTPAEESIMRSKEDYYLKTLLTVGEKCTNTPTAN